MTSVSIDADIKAKWADGHSSYSPGSTEELALIGIDLLVKELGTEAAQQFIKQIFERYPIEQTEHALGNKPAGWHLRAGYYLRRFRRSVSRSKNP